MGKGQADKPGFPRANLASLWALATLLECQLGSAHHQDGCFPSSSPGAPLTPQRCQCCFLLLFPKDMIRFICDLPGEIGFSTKNPEYECRLAVCPSVSVPLPQSLVPMYSGDDKKSPGFESGWRHHVSLMACGTGSWEQFKEVSLLEQSCPRSGLR